MVNYHHMKSQEYQGLWKSLPLQSTSSHILPNKLVQYVNVLVKQISITIFIVDLHAKCLTRHNKKPN
jgi:hypothetical protein